MGTYAITGATTGIGAAVREKLQAQGDTVISIDIRDADIVADLATDAGCEAASKALQEKASSGLDGLVPCAGVGPSSPGNVVAALNYTGVVKAVEGAMPLLEKKQGSVVLISSNSIPMKADNEKLCALLLDGKYTEAHEHAKNSDGHANYTGTKKALVLWMRRNCAGWVKRGVRVNAVAPGMTMTRMVQEQFNDPQYKERMEQFRDAIPMGSAEPADIADPIIFLLKGDGRYCCGSLLFVDGGIDALTRQDTF